MGVAQVSFGNGFKIKLRKHDCKKGLWCKILSEMATLLHVLYLLALLLSSTYVQTQKHPLYVYIDGGNGRDSRECLTYNSIREPCRTLTYVADNLDSASVDIYVLSDWLNLTDAVEFNDFQHLQISGNKSTINCPETNAGIAFIHIRELDIMSLSIEGCGAERNSTNINLEKNVTEPVDVAVYIVNCTDLAINNLNVSSSNGRGLSVYDTNGTVSITNCLFDGNHPNTSTQTGGGGLYIEFTFCSPGFVSNCYDRQEVTNSSYFITNCTFSNNIVAIPMERETVISPSNPLSVPRIGKGGGVYISIGSDSLNNSFTLRCCTFYNNSATLVGGAMLTEFLNSAQNTTVSLYESKFTDNHCTHESNCSTGLVIGLMLYDKSQILGKVPFDNTFVCYNCTFESNKGGGVIIFASKENVCPYTYGKIEFIKGYWTKNTSPMGAAVFMTPGIWDYTHEGCLPVPRFVNCTFENNSALESQPSYVKRINMRVTSLGYGTLSTTQFTVQFEGSVLFRHNQGTAVHASNSVLDFHKGSTAEFINNTAHKGGAIAMYGTSVLQFENNCVFRFTGNQANSLEGAIYVEYNAAFHPEYRNCFVQSASQNCSKANTTFYFEGNYAKASGNSIFATTFRSCAFLCHHHNVTLPVKILQQIANFIFNDRSPLATRPTSFQLDTNSLEIIPGMQYYLPLLVKDENEANLTGMVCEASVNSTKNITIDPAFNQVSHNVIKLRGTPNQSAELHLQASESNVVLSFPVNLTNCPPGYVINGSQCVCGVSDYLGLVGCNPDVKLKSGYWIGFCSNTEPSKICTTFVLLDFAPTKK